MVSRFICIGLMKDLEAVDFFCGAGGMTYGFSQAGIKVLAGIDIDRKCKETYEINNRNSIFINKDIAKLSFEELSETIKIRQNQDSLVFIGCSPCQYWTILNTDKKKSESCAKKEKKSVLTFLRFFFCLKLFFFNFFLGKRNFDSRFEKYES